MLFESPESWMGVYPLAALRSPRQPRKLAGIRIEWSIHVTDVAWVDLASNLYSVELCHLSKQLYSRIEQSRFFILSFMLHKAVEAKVHV